MAFDITTLKNLTPATHVPAAATAPTRALIQGQDRAAVSDLAGQLAASVAAVAINRPSRRPVVPASEALTVTSIEGPAAAHAMFEIVDTEAEEITDPKGSVASAQLSDTSAPATPVITVPPAPKARRGRPRKKAAAVIIADTADASTVSAAPRSDEDPKAQTSTMTAPGCASTAGDPCVDVSAAFSALLDAVGVLQAAVAQLTRGGGDR